MLSGIITALLLVLFIAGWVWAWSPRRKSDFDAAARLPLDDQEPVRAGVDGIASASIEIDMAASASGSTHRD